MYLWLEKRSCLFVPDPDRVSDCSPKITPDPAPWKGAESIEVFVVSNRVTAL
jgi:hypothetical protein